MKRTDITNKKIPDSPGVYFFLGNKKEILYIGRATSLRNRVKSYFASDIREKRSELIAKMVDEAKKVEWTVTDSVLEAMILEVNLIRTHKPRYNTISKDDKSYNHLVITDEEWPRVLVVRGKDLTEKFTESEIKYHFGPFPSGQLFREALKIIRKIFKYYDTKKPIEKETSKVRRGQIDFNRQIGLYPNNANQKDYLKTIRQIKLFFSGQKNKLIKELETEMLKLAKKEKFEEANVLKKRIFALKHIEDVALLKSDAKVFRSEKNIRLEAYDVAHLGGENMVGVMVVVEGGEVKKSDYRKFKIKSVAGSNDTGALKEVLERRLAHPEWPSPQIIVVDGGTAQKNAAEFVLKKNHISIPVLAVVKDEKHNPKQIIGGKKLVKEYEDQALLANSEAHRFSITYHKKKRNQSFLK